MFYTRCYVALIIMYTQEEREIIKRYHKYIKDLWESDNINLSLVKPEKFNIQDEMSCQWLVLAVLSIQDEVKRDLSNAT